MNKLRNIKKCNLYFIGLINLIISIILINFIYNYELSIPIIIYLIIIWHISAFLTDKYYLKYKSGYLSYHLTPAIKSFLIMILFVLLLFAFYHAYTCMILIMTVFVSSLLDVIVRFFYFKFYNTINKNEFSEYTEFDFDSNQQEVLDFNKSKILSFNTSVFSKIIKEHKYKIIIDILKENKVNIIPENPSSVTNPSSVILDSKQYQTKVINNNMADIYYLNILLNNIRYIGKKLKYITSKMNAGGWLIIEYRPLDKIEEKIKHMPSGKFIYLVHFFLKRVLPKIPIINKIYFIITHGRNRAISRTEVWGRLIYCGFEITKEVPFEDYFIILARRTKTISLNKPSFYPIIKLNRIGFNNKIIQVYKVRSMFPFSEYLQQKIFEEKGMSNTGHFNDDTRITEYGRIIRKLWIDELPQLYHWLKGDIKLVGIRAMSIQYFKIHSKEYQYKYIRVMPGLVPPIFDSSITGFDQIAKVEEDYLDSYVRNRIKTDWKYFLVTLKDILFRGVRSS